MPEVRPGLPSWSRGALNLSVTPATSAPAQAPSQSQVDEFHDASLIAPTSALNDAPPDVPLDQFGVAMLYPSASGGDSWFMDANTLDSDKRVTLKGTAKHVAGDVWNGKSGGGNPPTFRVVVDTKSGYNAGVSSARAVHHDLLAKDGYMQDPGDWKNIEITGYFDVKSVNKASEQVTMYARGGAHTESPKTRECEGTAYKPRMGFDGNPSFAKEYYHNGGSGYVFPNVSANFNLGSILNKWVGMKAVIKNEVMNGKTVVHTQVYIDPDPTTKMNDWKLWYELTDDGTWAGKPFVTQTCNAPNAREVLSWGGPQATFRIDDINSMDFKWLSVREIDPNARPSM